jgi:excinuclease ABC subunit C
MEKGLAKKIKNLPQKPGVYIFKDKEEKIIYIGKAKNLRKRVRSHFQKKQNWVWDFLDKIEDIDYFKCQNEPEAILLETDLIKKYQPKYNIEWKDDKNYFFVGIESGDFGRVFLTHQKKSQGPKIKNQKIAFLGPFINGRELKNFLAEIRKILPFRTCKTLPQKSCLYFDLGLCLAPCINKRQKKKYQKIIETLKIILKIYQGENKRIEAYDVSNISGVLVTGAMAVFERHKKI